MSLSSFAPRPKTARHPLQVLSRVNGYEIVALNHASTSSRRFVERCRCRLAAHHARFPQMAAVVLVPNAGCVSHAVEPPNSYVMK